MTVGSGPWLAGRSPNAGRTGMIFRTRLAGSALAPIGWWWWYGQERLGAADTLRAHSVPSEMSPKDTWTSEQLHASNHPRLAVGEDFRRIWWSRSHFSDRLIKMPTNQQKQLLVLLWQQKENFPQFLPLASHKHVSKSCWRSTAGNWIFHPILSFAGDWIFHLRSCWCSTGLLFICLMSCWWLDTMFSIFSPVGARRDFC